MLGYALKLGGSKRYVSCNLIMLHGRIASRAPFGVRRPVAVQAILNSRNARL
jgi:hypothetical protein